jgi:fluoride exporter
VRDVLTIAVAGACGSVSRYAMSALSYRVFGQRFAYGTLVVNVLGCLLLGFFMQLAASNEWVERSWRIPITIGFFGAFTTFSTFGYETMRYMQDGLWFLASTNIVASVLLCLIAVWGGLSAGRWLFASV